MLNVPSSQTGSVDTHPPEPVDSPETSEAAVDADGNDTPPPKRGRSSWWSSLSVGLKLGLSFGLLGLAVGLLGAATWTAGQNITSQGQILVGEQLPIERSVREWRTQSIQLGEMALRTTSSSDVFPLTMAISRLVEQEKALVEDITSRVQVSAGRLEMASTLESALSSRASYAVKRDQLVEDALEGKLVSQRQKSEHEEALQAYLRAIDDMLGVSERAAQQAADVTMANARRAQWVSVWAVVLVIAVAACLGWLLRRSILVPLSAASHAVFQVAEGDLTTHVEVDRNDEFGQVMNALNGMVQSLHHVVTEVRDAAESIHVASTEVAAGNMDLSTRTEQAAGNLEETAASLEQLTGMVRVNAENTRLAHDLVNDASRAAADGGQVVGDVVVNMNGIQKSSQRIAEIVEIIDAIASQTNILALNAAVEAARAGEQGRGFAVVAIEVRNLASRSSEAAKEIERLIESSVKQVAAGARLAQQAGSTMSGIVDRVKGIQALMGEISAATQRQSEEIDQVAHAVSLLDEMTQQNAALVEQGTAAAQSLKDQATRLHGEMESFRLHEATQSDVLAPSA